jgi:hypothetical protein
MKKNVGLLPLKMRKGLSLRLGGGAPFRWRIRDTNGLRAGSGAGRRSRNLPLLPWPKPPKPVTQPIFNPLNPAAGFARIAALRIVDQLIHFLMQYISKYFGIIYY